MNAGQDRRAGPGRARLHRARSTPIPRQLLAAEPKPDRRRRNPTAPVVVRDRRPQSLVSDQARRAAPARSATSRRSTASHRAAQGRDARRGRRVRLGQDDARPRHPAPDLLEGPIVFMGNRSQGLHVQGRCGRSAATCRSCSRTRTARSRRACRSPTSSRKACGCIIRKLTGGRARAARDRARSTDVGLDPDTRFRYPHEFSGGQRQRIARRARDRAGADLRRARRADQRARHADPGADRRSAARAAEASAISPTCSSRTT